MRITEEVKGYDKVAKFDEEKNDMQRVLLSNEAQQEAVMEAASEGVWEGYSELWEDGFTVKDEEGERLEDIEAEMNSMYVGAFERLIKEFFEGAELC